MQTNRFRKLCGAILGLSFALAVAGEAQAASWSAWQRVDQLYLKDARQVNPRLYVRFAGVTNMCGVGTEYAYYDMQEGIGDEVKSMLTAAFLSGKRVRLNLTANTTTCRIEDIQVGN